MKNHVRKEQSLATKLAISLSALSLIVVGILSASIGSVDKVWEHTLGICMLFAGILLIDSIEDKKKFVKDLINLFK